MMPADTPETDAPEPSPTVPLSLRLPAWLHEALRRWAYEDRVSMNAMIVTWCSERARERLAQERQG